MLYNLKLQSIPIDLRKQISPIQSVNNVVREKEKKKNIESILRGIIENNLSSVKKK